MIYACGERAKTTPWLAGRSHGEPLTDRGHDTVRPAGSASIPMRLQTFASLRSSSYRKYFFVQLVSTIGIWFRLIAEGWLVVELSDGSGWALGVTAALQFGPMLMFGLYAGVLVDRANRRRIVIITQALVGLLALVLWFVTSTGIVTLWMVWLAVGAMGVINAIDIPAREAFTKELVGRELIPNAVALNTGVLSVGRMLGPAAAGLLIANTGTPSAFLVNACTYGLVVVVLTRIKPKELFRGEPAARKPGQAREGLAYVADHDILRPVVAGMFLAFTFAYNFMVLLPILAFESFRGGSQLYGYLMSAMGSGYLIGSLVAASLTWTGVRHAATTASLLAAAQFAVAASPTGWTAAVAAAFMGFAASIFQITCSGTLQRETDEDKRGRVMALYAIGFTGTGAIGGPALGAIAEAWGPRGGFVAAGAACLAAGGVMTLMRRGTTISSP
jgi:MFS family permease